MKELKSTTSFSKTKQISSYNSQTAMTSTKDSANEKLKLVQNKPMGDMTLEEIAQQLIGDKPVESDSSSCFISSSDEEDRIEIKKKNRKFIPLYRKEHGGIVIYD